MPDTYFFKQPVVNESIKCLTQVYFNRPFWTFCYNKIKQKYKQS